MTSALGKPSIRSYAETDAAATLAIFIDAITITAALDYSPEQVQAWARPGQRNTVSWNLSMSGRTSFVATVNDEVAGFSDIDEHGYIDMLFVAPRHQRKGIARALLAEAERRFREHGGTCVTADVSITARPFFESSGFSVEQEQHPVRQGVSLVNFRMSKSLPSVVVSG
ncbi:GNAT family N-acetyltransferase [Microbacterium sp. A82]|uniref:GNAT family N-acetyltransferase n=1 Tax=Microbacterium sp. A82 TaxID=3450452 RepID=UPI003F2CC4A9